MDGKSCAQADMFICLTPNASQAFKASELDPDNTGYIIAMVVNNDGLPDITTPASVLIGKHTDKIENDRPVGVRSIPVLLGEQNSLVLNKITFIAGFGFKRCGAGKFYGYPVSHIGEFKVAANI